MFDTLHKTYRDIITCVGIVGYSEEDIISNNFSKIKNLPLNCLYAYPNKETAALNSLIYEMMFPDNNHKIPCPKFFVLNLTDQYGQHSFLYCLKFNENYKFIENNDILDINNLKEIEVPIVIFIKSEKEDLECFKQLFNIINYIIVNDDLKENEEVNNNYNINDFKKVQLLNIFYFLISLLRGPPHSLVKLKFENEVSSVTLESIDFYFSSNCEIPCNKNDTDINILFLLLDQSIILKILFSILTEKQIVFRASQAYLLHIIIPSFLKLIFPFKWIQACITVLPKEKLSLIESPLPFIFGVLSDTISLNDLIREYPNIIVVDIDTNEIFGDSYYEPYFPPKNQKIEGAAPHGSGMLQGNNFITVEGSYLYKYEKENEKKKMKMEFNENNNIIIDSQKCQMLVDKTDIFVNNNERKWLRKNIQMVRNPEIFDLENINNGNNKNNYNSNKIYLNDENDEDIILPNRPFSYNIQNIFMIYILNKLQFTKSEFMSIFMKTDLFKRYNSQSKYQNNSGRKISENIFELKIHNCQKRNIENCFTIEYNLQNFKAQSVLKKINSKLKKLDKEDTKSIKELEQLQKIFQNYSELKNDEDFNTMSNPKDDFYNIPGRKSDLKSSDFLLKLALKRHQRTKTSLLKETNFNNNSYNFLFESSLKNDNSVLNFYQKNGFIKFINNFEKFLKEENYDIKDDLYEDKIYEQLLDIINNDDSIFNQNKNLVNNIINKDDKDEKKDIINNIENINDISKDNTHDTSNNYLGRNSFLQKSNNIIINKRSRSIESEFGLYSDIDINNFLYSETIINFIPNFSEDKTQEINNEKKDNNVNLKSQYYLYIVTFLEKMMESKEKTEDFIEKIKSKKKLDELNIKSLITKMYRRAYNCSGKEHLDFPYFSYYSFMKNIELKELKSLNDEFLYIGNDETELYEIYENVVKEKELVIAKKEEKLKKKLEREKKLKNSDDKLKDNNIIKKNFTKLQDIFNFFENKNTEKNITKNVINTETKKEDIKYSYINKNPDFNYFITYQINNSSEFNINPKNHSPDKDIIISIAEEILSLLPNKKDINTKINDIILQEVNTRLIQNKKLFELIGNLKYFSIEKLISYKQRLCFWTNCFNFLILFTIFYKKWEINSKDDWKYFFQNVVYYIGNKKYTFNDMQYILFKRPLFFPSSYKTKDEIKKYRIDKVDDAKNYEKKYELINNPFGISLPTKEFLKPSILKESDLDDIMNKRIEDFFEKYIYIDEANNINLPELLLNYSSRFLYKEYKKYHQYMKPNIYNLIKEKKYKKNIVINIEFKLDFDNLLE